MVEKSFNWKTDVKWAPNVILAIFAVIVSAVYTDNYSPTTAAVSLVVCTGCGFALDYLAWKFSNVSM